MLIIAIAMTLAALVAMTATTLTLTYCIARLRPLLPDQDSVSTECELRGILIDPMGDEYRASIMIGGRAYAANGRTQREALMNLDVLIDAACERAQEPMEGVSESLHRGLAQSDAGELHDFAQFADDGEASNG